ncbi:MAG: hypothetical protein J0M01_17295 [Dechloromonas sp.]|jgi:hypothetical protein|nr:hypothetical protein [Dechloromonas sp.]
MRQPVRILNATNIAAITADFHNELEDIGKSVAGLSGLPLLIAVKRARMGHDPYPDVTLFEAANRIMSDLVILHGVAQLLQDRSLPFQEYRVEFGNEDRNGFDICASVDQAILCGEAFNVAPSFFQGKKRTALKKLRDKAAHATHRLILFNEDAPPKDYVARTEEGIRQLAVHIPVGVPASGA